MSSFELSGKTGLLLGGGLLVIGVILGRLLQPGPSTGADEVPVLGQGTGGEPVDEPIGAQPVRAALPVQEGPVDELLAELYQVDPRTKDFQRSKDMSDEALAYWTSWELREVPFSNARHAILECLPPDRATQLLACVQARISEGRLPADYLDRPLEKEIRGFEPVGQFDLERALLYSTNQNERKARKSFLKDLDRQLRIHKPFPFQDSQLVNPEAKELKPPFLEHLVDLDAMYQIELEGILGKTDLFLLQLEARQSELAKGNYEYLPSEISGMVQAGCDRGYYEDQPVVDQGVSSGGWGGRLRISQGLYPDLDAVMRELWDWQDRRIASLQAEVGAY